MGDRIDVIETSIQDIINNDVPTATSTNKATNAVNNGLTDTPAPEGGNSSTGDDSLMHTAAPEGVSDDSSSTIDGGRA